MLKLTKTFGIITLLFCSVAAGQECLGPLNSFGVTQTYDPATGYTHITGGVTRRFHKITVDYYDNRETIRYSSDTTFHTYGEFTLENLAPESGRYIKYRRTVDIPPGYYDIERLSLPSYGIQLCVDNSEFIMSKSSLRGGGYSPSFTYPFEYMAHRILVGDVNNDGCINGGDLGLVIALWGTDDIVMDINGDGLVDGGDIGLVVANFSDPNCVPNDEEDGPYNPAWELADDIVVMEVLDLPTPTGNDQWILLPTQVSTETYRGSLDLIEDTGNAGPALFIDLGNWQAIGVSNWTATDSWIVEVWRAGEIIATTSTHSYQPMYPPDGTTNYGNSAYWKYLVPWHDFVVGDRWILYKWRESYPENVLGYPPDRFYDP
jgi:hypothetical protein